MKITSIFKLVALSFVCLFILPMPGICLVDNALDFFHIIKDITLLVLKACDVENNDSNVPLPTLIHKQQKLLLHINEISKQISRTEQQHTEQIGTAVNTINNFIESNLQLTLKYDEVIDVMNQVSSNFKEMEQYDIYQDKLEVLTLVAFATKIVMPNSFSVSQLMERLHLIIFGSEKSVKLHHTLFDMLLQNYEASMEARCLHLQSTQQFLFSLYTDIALTELKGYAMMEFAWMILRIHGKGNFTQESELMRQNYIERTGRTVNLLRDVMKRADRVVWRCDPEEHVKGKTYEEVTRLLQGYIENEVDMSKDSECWKTCEDYDQSLNEGCFKDKFCARQERCSGRIHNCKYIDSDMFICQSDRNSVRRYEYIHYENQIAFGHISSCRRGKTPVDSWWRYIFWHCSYCFCYCDDIGSQKTDRYFNLRETVSNVNDNKVVTGLRFIKVNRIFHLQIQEGVLLGRGIINQTTLSWKRVDNYTLNERNVRNGHDYHTLNYGALSIDLDDIHTDNQEYVVTGVRFRVLGAHLNLEARLSEFNFESGNLINPEDNSFWKSNDNTDVSGEKRVKIVISDTNIPTRARSKSIPDSHHNQYIEFTPTGLHSDAAQSTVPFIDIQDVISNPPVPLAGVGIYHKGNLGYGGFIGPKLLTYDFAPHIQQLKVLPPSRKLSFTLNSIS